MPRQRPTKRERLASVESRLAAAIRQFDRATEADDQLAVANEADCICRFTHILLSMHLDDADDWESDARWIDGLTDAQITKTGDRSIFINGNVLWRLAENPGGTQWSSPMFAKFAADDGGLVQYELCFELSFGLYSPFSAIKDASRSDRIDPSRCFTFRGSGGHPL